MHNKMYCYRLAPVDSGHWIKLCMKLLQILVPNEYECNSKWKMRTEKRRTQKKYNVHQHMIHDTRKTSAKRMHCGHTERICGLTIFHLFICIYARNKRINAKSEEKKKHEYFPLNHVPQHNVNCNCNTLKDPPSPTSVYVYVHLYMVEWRVRTENGNVAFHHTVEFIVIVTNLQPLCGI